MNITVRILDEGDTPKPIVIYDDGSRIELFDIIHEFADEKWYFQEGEQGRSWTYLISNDLNAEIKFRIKADPDRYILFEKNERNGKAIISVNGSKQIINTYIGNGTTEIEKVYPFKDIIRRAQIFVNVLLLCIATLVFARIKIQKVG